jgi:hypothetical protein
MAPGEMAPGDTAAGAIDGEGSGGRSDIDTSIGIGWL